METNWKEKIQELGIKKAHELYKEEVAELECRLFLLKRNIPKIIQRQKSQIYLPDEDGTDFKDYDKISYICFNAILAIIEPNINATDARRKMFPWRLFISHEQNYSVEFESFECAEKSAEEILISFGYEIIDSKSKEDNLTLLKKQ